MSFEGNVTSVLYGLVGLYTLYRLYLARASFFDHVVTSEDFNLAVMIGLFVLTPFSVLVHEAGHYFTAEHFGATAIELHHRGSWGFVSYSAGPDFDSSTRLLISGAGPLLGVLLAFSSMAAAVALPVRRVIKKTLALYGLFGGFHILIGYPLIDLTSDLEGDFHTIYRLLPTAGVVVAGLAHALLVALLLVSWSRPPTRELFRDSSY